MFVYGHALMALRAGKDAGSKRGRRYKKLFRNVLFFSVNTRRKEDEGQQCDKTENPAYLIIFHIISPFPV
jgi:hypothetical protein